MREACLIVRREVIGYIRYGRFLPTILVCAAACVMLAICLKGNINQYTGTECSLLGTTDIAAISVIPILMSALLCDTISGDITQGTARLILVRPVRRSSLWWSKFLACVLISWILLASIWLISYLVFGTILGFGSWFSHTLFTQSTGDYTLWDIGWRAYSLEAVSIIAVVCFVMCISSFNDTPAWTISIAIAGILLGTLLSLRTELSPIAQNAFFPELPLAGFVTHMRSSDQNHSTASLPGNLIVLTMWCIVFVSAGLWRFTTRDIA